MNDTSTSAFATDRYDPSASSGDAASARGDIGRRRLLRLAMGAAIGSASGGVAGIAGLGPRCALAATEYPSRTIRWIVPYLPGTAPDNTARVMAEALAAILRQPIIIENKPGAAGNLGAQLAARAAADGYTWVYAASPMAASMRMYRKPGYDVLKDFIHVGRVTMSDLTVAVRADSPYRSLQDLLADARANPGKLTYASGGIGSPSHLATELMLSAAGVSALHVPYQGASDSVTALLSQQVDFALMIFSVAAPQVDNGKLRPLATTGRERNPRMAGVPTLAESGVRDVALVSFGGIAVPAGTPPAVVERISSAMQEAMQRSEVRARLEANGAIVSPADGREFTEDLRAEIGQTERLMKIANVERQ